MNQKQPLNSHQKDACTKASEMISNIEFLQSRSEFIAFMEKLKARADGMAEQVLHDNNISAEEREAIRRTRLGILECLQSPSEDVTAQKSLLRAFGMSDGG